ncbi:MAG: periplasmic heavy metal sensor, partial [Rhizobiales bacterium]|nr:periplasmic heavy metal sensor [Hyphomicrobiales bacterium]
MSAADTPEPKRRRWLPELKSRWWSALLIASLAINLLIAAAVVTHFVRGGGGRSESLGRPGYAQLIPRKFFSDLPRERRRELYDVLKKYRGDFRTGREDARANALKLADAL